MTITFEAVRAELMSKNIKSAYDKGVREYALELLDSLDDIHCTDTNLSTLSKNLLNGAESWTEYSYGGCSLICDSDIAERLCNKSQFKRSRDGETEPYHVLRDLANPDDTWLDVQARALSSAYHLIFRAYCALARKETKNDKH